MIVCLDTNVVIYLVERDPIWTPKAVARVTAIQTAGDSIAVCDATILECLLKPLLTGDTRAEAAFRTFFADPLIQMLPVSRATWEQAAQVGAKFNFKPMDSLHLATTVEHGCGLFLTPTAGWAAALPSLSRC